MNRLAVVILEQLGEQSMRSGRFDHAIQCYSEAAVMLGNRENEPRLRARVHRMLGVCYRLTGNYEESLTHLEAATTFAANSGEWALLAGTRRDHAMTSIAMTQHDEQTLDLLEEAYEYFVGVDKQVSKQVNGHYTSDESWFTLGCIGWAHLARGDTENAGHLLYTAYCGLRGLQDGWRKPEYELDTLIHLMHVVNRRKRKELAKAAYTLIDETEQDYRSTEVMFLSLGGPRSYRLARHIHTVRRKLSR